MIFLYTIYSNIQQYALIDVQLNEKKTQVTDKNTQKPRRHQKNPDLVEKPSCGNTARHRSGWRDGSKSIFEVDKKFI